MTAINELSFEQAYAQLETVLIRLESGDLTLEESVTLYQQGKALSGHCQALLDRAEMRIKSLDEDGTLHDVG